MPERQRTIALAALALEELGLAVTLTDPEGVLLYYNPKAAALLDRRPEQIDGDIRSCHKKPESNAKIDDMLAAFKQGRLAPYNYEALRYGRRLSVTIKPLSRGGELLGVMQVVREIQPDAAAEE
jgi:PAS domain-containing protein